MQEPTRDAGIKLRASPQQRDLIGHAAALLGKSRAAFMLEVACERAQAIVLDQVVSQLDVESFRRFGKFLDAPSGANTGLDKLIALKAQGAQNNA